MVYSKHGPIVRVVYLAVACAYWVLTGRGRFAPGRVVVLCFHSIAASQRDRFERMVRYISRRAVSTRSLDCHHPRGMPRVCLTFDDAFANLLENALPVLQEYKVPGTVYAVSDVLGTTPKWAMPKGHPESAELTMTPEQLKGAASDTVRIGSHTCTHPVLTRLDASALHAELENSKATLEALADSPVDELAFPHGAYDIDTVRAAERAGYRSLFSLDPVLYPCRSKPDVIGRFSADPSMWYVEFALTCDGAYAWLYLFRRAIQGLRHKPDAHCNGLSMESV
jgi:peptidoglycan/xylan/chitin deacetylase (PgdA/CDA1 family)